MASTIGPSPPSDHLSLESIPTVDLRLLSQSELTALSLCSSHAFDLRRCDDVVIPKIDRSVFNESAGSRKQTYSRLRLAPRNSNSNNNPNNLTNASNNNGGNTNTFPKPRPPPSLSPLDNDNSRIISLFKALFNGEPISENNYDDNNINNNDDGFVYENDDDANASALVPVNVEYSDSFLGGDGGGGDRKRKRGRKPNSGGSGDMALAVTPIVTTTMAEEEDAMVEDATVEDEEERRKEEAAKKEAREKELVNKNGEVVDLRELAKKEDPYGEEIRRRTQGRDSPDELLEFIRDLDGVWGSRRKKRKIVDANQFGDVLPVGWKVLIAMKKKQGRAWVFCRRYISPNGRYFVSCKEVSSYLLSLTSPEDLKQQTDAQCPEGSVVENKFPSENATDLGTKVEYLSLCVTPQSNDHETLQKSLSASTSHSNDHEKQLVLFTTAHSEDVHASSALKCHKCSTGFGEKDELLNHLLKCHKRKRRKSGAPIEDDILMKDGKYECQFCNKVFHERSSYFGHVGIHVKNYARSIGGSPGVTVTSKQTSSTVSVTEVPVSVPVTEVPVSVPVTEVPVTEIPVSVSVTEVPVSNSVDDVPVSVSVGDVPLSVSADEVPITVSADEVPVTVSEARGEVETKVVPIASSLNIPTSSELNLNSTDSKPEADCEGETHLGHGKIDQNNLSLHAELITEDVQSNKVSFDESSCKNNGPAHTTDNNVMEVEEAVEVSTMKLDSCSGSEDLYNSENNDLCENLCEINGAECLGSEISKSSAELVENDEICFLSDSKQVDLGNDDHSTSNILQREKLASEIDLYAENKDDSLVDHNSEVRCLENNIVKCSSFTEDLEVGEEEGLMDHSDIGHFDLGIDMTDDVQDPGSLDECSDGLHKEEETCDTTAKRIEFMNSPLVVSYENSSPSEDQPANVVENYAGKGFIGMISETEVDICSLDGTEATVETDRCLVEERPESCTTLLSKDSGSGYIANESQTIPHIEMVERRETGAFQVEQSCTLEKTPRQLFNSNAEEPKSDQVMNSSNLFFTPGNNDTQLADSVISSDVQAHRDVNNVLGAFNNFIEDKPDQIPKSIISGLTINEHLREVAMNNVTDVPSTATSTQLPDLDKVDGSRTNKLIFDFGNITEMNARFLSSVQNEAVPEGTSPFSLWGQQTCAVEDNQNRVYDGARGVAQQERASDNNSLNFVGLQQSSDVRYNLNEVCMNEQRYGVQHNETGVYRENTEVRREGMYGGARGIVQQERTPNNNSLNLFGIQQPSHAGFNLNKVHMNEQGYGVQLNESGVYSKSNDSRREGISHGNTLNLAGLQQHCDVEYNLNKPCINQQSYGMRCNETGAYSTSDKSKQERGTYGNSLSLASVPQTCETGYSLNKSCIQQTCDTGFSLNKGYMGTMQGLSKLDELGHSRDQDLMLGFSSSNGRPNQGVATDYLWRATEGGILPGGLMDSSSSQGQSSGSYQAFDFLSDKGGNDLYAANEKFDNMSSFEGLRSTSVEPMEFSFMTTQDSNAQLGHQKVLTFNAQMDQGFGSNVWHQKPSLPNMMAGHVVSTLCVWCGNEFHQDSLGCEMQAGSIGYLCPTCKARMSGQFL